MKKIFLFVSAVSLLLIISNCSSKKKLTTAANDAVATDAPKREMGFKATVLSVINASCSPCHIYEKGKKEPYDILVNAKNKIDEIIRRVELLPEQRGFMPKNGTKLSTDAVAVLKQWKVDGFPE